MTPQPSRAARPAGAPSSVADLLALGLGYHKAGRIPEAIDLYTEVLQLDRDQPYALHLLGEIAHRAGRNERAVELIERAVTLMPELAEAHNNLGTAYQALGRLGEAEASYRRAIELKPSLLIARSNLGAVLKAQGNVEEARRQVERVLTLDPRAAEACVTLGDILREERDYAAAEDCYRIATEQRPDNAAAWNNLGIMLMAQRRNEEARDVFERAVALDSHSAEAHNNLGNALRELGKFKEAVAWYEKALAIRPLYPQALSNMGAALAARFMFQEALPFLRKAVECDPGFIDALLNLGACLRNLDRLSEALECFDRALELEPENPRCHNYRGLTLIETGVIEDGLAQCRKAFRLDPNYMRAQSNYLFGLNYRAEITGAEMLAEHRAFEIPSRQPPARSFANRTDPERRLRVAYISPDFKRHSCAFFIEPLLAAHDKADFEVFCYSDVPLPDPVTLRIKQHADHWRDINKLPDAELADAVRADEIDIAIELAGHTGQHRLNAFATRIAPIQISWLGYPCTTGLSAIGFRLTDAIADPPGMTDAHYTETLVRLPQTFLCYRPHDDAPEAGPLPALTGNPFTFGSFNNLPKINDRVIGIWARILSEAPGTRLLLKSRSLADEPTCARIRAAFETHGIGASRLELVAWIGNPADHLRLYDRIDLALDPFPYNGTTTTCEAMWMGVPVLTLAGERHAARVGASLLTQVGLQQFVTNSVEAYVDRAVALVRQLGELAAVRRDLRGNMAASPLCDGAAFARDVEHAYRALWRDWCRRSRISEE